jgi:hypothetical protein
MLAPVRWRSLPAPRSPRESSIRFFSNKQAMLATHIAERTKRMLFPLESPASLDRKRSRPS